MGVIAARLKELRLNHRPSGNPVVVPMAGHYRRDGEFEARRNRFYADMNRVFGLEGWVTVPDITTPRFTMPGTFIHGARISRNETVDIAITTPFEWLVFNRRLGLHSESLEQSRVKAAMLFRRDMLMREISSIKGPDYSGMRQLGGTFGTRDVADYRLEAMRSVSQLRDDMPDWLFRVLEDVLVLDAWLWEGRPPSSQHVIFKTIECALDCASVHYGLMTLRDFRVTWPVITYKKKERV